MVIDWQWKLPPSTNKYTPQFLLIHKLLLMAVMCLTMCMFLSADSLETMQVHTSEAAHTRLIREDPPGVPLYHVPVSDVANLEPGGPHTLPIVSGVRISENPIEVLWC